MGTADGAVLGTAKIVDHGADALRWTLVILAEGFRSGDLGQFHVAAESFATKIRQTSPFDRMWDAVNVYRVDVRSTDEGADQPAKCADCTIGTGVIARTYFDASFCTAGTGRLLWGNEALALSTASGAIPEVDATVVIVNSTRYGGAGGPVAWFSLGATADEIGLHELGHAAFRLADEYGDSTCTWTDGYPPEPNVTTVTDRVTTKWAVRIAAETPLPTMDNLGCHAMTAAPSPVPAGTVGLFAGGRRVFCGIYHPEHDCRMRTLGTPFCSVCQTAIVDRLSPYLPKFSEPLIVK